MAVSKDLSAMKLYLYDTSRPMELMPLSSPVKAKAEQVKPSGQQLAGASMLSIGGQKVAARIIDPMKLWRLTEWSVAHAKACDGKAKDIVGHGWEFEDEAETPQTKEIDEVFNRSRLELYNIARDCEITGWANIELQEYSVGQRLYKLVHIPSWSCWPTLDEQRIVHQASTRSKPVIFDRLGADMPAGYPLMVQVNGNHMPATDYYGVPDAVSAFGMIESIHNAIDYNREFFEKRGGYRWLVLLEEPNGQSDASADADLVQKIHYNVSEVGKGGSKTDMLIIPVGDRKVVLHKLDADARDMDFTEMFTVYRNEILAANEVPPLVANYIETGQLGGEVGAEQLINYRESTIRPKQEMIWEPALNQIVQFYWPGAPYLKLKSLFVDERFRLITPMVQLFDRNALTVNELRVAAGFEPLATGGDERRFEMAQPMEFTPQSQRGQA